MKKLYEKYMVNNKSIFYAFIAACTILFLVLCSNIQVEVVRTYECVVSSESVIINDVLSDKPEVLYLYKDKGKNVSKYSASKIEYIDGMKTVIYIEPIRVNSANNGLCSVDIVEDEATLWEIITYQKSKQQTGE